jgi:hypothetical protein
VTPLEALLATVALGAGVAAGTVCHELAHALALRAARVPYDLVWLPDGSGRSVLHAAVTGRWATVEARPRPGVDDATPVRVAALMPLALAAPFLLVPAGVLPDPLAGGDPVVVAAVVGWLACALPSPRDFSVAFYADSAAAVPDARTR